MNRIKRLPGTTTVGPLNVVSWYDWVDDDLTAIRTVLDGKIVKLPVIWHEMEPAGGFAVLTYIDGFAVVVRLSIGPRWVWK
jgi:hypothetical protein